MPSPDYLPLVLNLPAVYFEDESSFDQLDSFLDLVDSVERRSVAALQSVERWLSPDSLSVWPPGLPIDAGEAAVVEAWRSVQDELAAWTGFTFPVTWPAGADGLERRRAYLRKASSLWRHRGTPRGLLDWFSLVFADALTGEALNGQVPSLVEHFRIADPLDADSDGYTPWLRATLFVPGVGAFADFGKRREAIAFVDRYAPAHVFVRVCWTDPTEFSLGAVPGPGASATAVTAWKEEVREILCSLVSFVDHAHGIRIWECVDADTKSDRLGAGRLPTTPSPTP